MFDSHTHIQFPAYDKDREEVIKRAQKAGVKMVAVGTNLQTSKEAIEIAEKYPEDIWATVGFHPNHVSDLSSEALAKEGSWYWDKNELRKPIRESFDILKFKDLANHPKVIAIGECGLDYYRGSQDKKIQEEIFKEQIKLAQETNKQLMIHCRPSKGSDDAYEDLIGILKTTNQPPTIIHFFVGSLDIAKKLLKLGCRFTFGGVITFVRDYDEVIKYLPLKSILLETDAPYVTPEPYRGNRNEPAYVIEVAKKLAEIKGVDYDKLYELRP